MWRIPNLPSLNFSLFTRHSSLFNWRRPCRSVFVCICPCAFPAADHTVTPSQGHTVISSWRLAPEFFSHTKTQRKAIQAMWRIPNLPSLNFSPVTLHSSTGGVRAGPCLSVSVRVHSPPPITQSHRHKVTQSSLPGGWHLNSFLTRRRGGAEKGNVRVGIGFLQVRVGPCLSMSVRVSVCIPAADHTVTPSSPLCGQVP